MDAAGADALRSRMADLGIGTAHNTLANEEEEDNTTGASSSFNQDDSSRRD